MKIIYMGTPDFAVPGLRAVHDAGHEIVAVYCQPPRAAGRGKKLRPSAVQAAAEALGLPVRHPVSLKDATVQAEFAALEADAAVVAAYGLILPQAVLDMPKHGCFNIHASLLPRWRGAAPIHRALMEGDRETGVCIMQMEAGLDTGPVLETRTLPISDRDTTQTLHDALADLGARAMVDVLVLLADGRAKADTQVEHGVTYAAKIDKAEARIDWTRTAQELDRQIRALTPFPGAWFDLDGERIKVHMALPVKGAVMPADTVPGQVLDHDLTIACGADALRIQKVQRAGKAAMEVTEFLRGRPVSPGARLD